MGFRPAWTPSSGWRERIERAVEVFADALHEQFDGGSLPWAIVVEAGPGRNLVMAGDGTGKSMAPVKAGALLMRGAGGIAQATLKDDEVRTVNVREAAAARFRQRLSAGE